MKVHHLNCGSFCLRGTKMNFACHCCLIETNQGLVLIDSGFSRQDLQHKLSRLGALSLSMGKTFHEKDALYHQVKGLGYRPEDVRHIVLTHLDPDHAGGIEDFPWAEIHVSEIEFDQVQKQMTTASGKRRFRLDRLSHIPKWTTYPETGETWKNLKAIRQLKGLPPEILLVPLHGHTSGHCGVAIEADAKWQLHAGDAYFKRVEISDNPIQTPISLQLFLAADSTNNKERFFNLSLLQQLRQTGDVDIFSSHDQDELKS